MTDWQKKTLKHVFGLITEPERVYIDGLKMERIAMNDEIILLINRNQRKVVIPVDRVVIVQTECRNTCLKLVITDNYYTSHEITLCN